MLRRWVMMVAVGACLPVFLVQVFEAVRAFGSVGFTRESWGYKGGVGYRSNIGVVDRDRALYFFVEHEQLVTASPDEDRVRWDTAGSPPQFTVGDSQLERDWTFLETGYQYSSVGFTWRRGQYHLVRVHALLVLGVTGLVSALGIREVIRIRHLRRRAAAGCCLVCGYDMRGGQEVCPECGTAKGERRVRLGEGTTRVS